MKEYQKDFAGWAKVAAEIEARERKQNVKPGVIYWANLGVNVGSGEDGKGPRFTRPVLLLARVNTVRGLIVPVTSQKKVGMNYRELVVAGNVEYLMFDQLQTIDIKCLEGVVDEINVESLRKVRGELLKVLKCYFYKITVPE